LLHFYLSYIHPFNDGNGRTARALFYWYMLNKGYWMFESLTISKIFIKAPAQYARAFLYTEMDELDLTYFMSFNIKVIKIAIQKLIEYIKIKQVEIKGITQHLQKYPELNHRQRELLRHSLDNLDAQYTVQEHKTINNITYETARRDLLYLTEKKLLIKTKKGRKFYFMPSLDLNSKIKMH
ncbi:MAG: Fic family protein, partial [Candidatus Omnitrophica bacterium]|nr:Fic family protein [Candidatus Omnitrophota bacterium]